MTLWLLLILHALTVVTGQKVAPGVPPQQYEYQQVPQHHQQVPQHHQQVPQQQFQQVPQQQHHQVAHQQMPQHQQAPQQFQQPPQQQQHFQQVPVQHVQMTQPGAQGHVPHGQPPQILNAANIAQEKHHIAEHLDVPMDTSKMSEQELQFHYFKMHDADNNNKLDGCELIKSLIHWHEQGHKDPHGEVNPQEKLFKDDELISLIDPILSMDDTNHDGFIDYPEFIQAQHKAAARPNP